MSNHKSDRCGFIKESSELTILPVVYAEANSAEVPTTNENFHPKEYRRERIQAPDDGKK